MQTTLIMLIIIYSHPRSGTHLLANFVENNFYKDQNLMVKNIYTGHWANRKLEPTVEAGKLMVEDTHKFPSIKDFVSRAPRLYIYRDGRAVAYSLWNTKHFLNHHYKDISFSEFLRMKLDWHRSPGYKSTPKYTIAEHWIKHVTSWLRIAKYNKHIQIIRFKDLVNNPEQIYNNLIEKFDFLKEKISSKDEIYIPQKLVGISPNSGKIDSWKSVFTAEDKAFFNSKIPSKYRHLISD